MAHVFISRDLTTDSVFLQTLQTAGHSVWGQSLVDIELLKAELPVLEVDDFVFFYSKNGVKGFKQSLGSQAALPEGLRMGAIGKATAAIAMAEFELSPVKAFEGAQAAANYINTLDAHRVHFMRGQDSLRSVQNKLESHIDCTETIVYANCAAQITENQSFAIRAADVVVLTSPLNAEVYCASVPQPASPIVIAIGMTTAAALRAILGSELSVNVAAFPYEEELAAAVIAALDERRF